MPEARVPPELQVLFAKVTMFTVTFPLTPAIALFVVWSETKSDIRRMLKYERRKVPRRLAYEHAIGPWYSILVVQTILGIVFSSFFFAFSTGELEATYVHVITTLSALPHFVATNSRKALAALELASSFFLARSSGHGRGAASLRLTAKPPLVLVYVCRVHRYSSEAAQAFRRMLGDIFSVHMSPCHTIGPSKPLPPRKPSCRFFPVSWYWLVRVSSVWRAHVAC